MTNQTSSNNENLDKEKWERDFNLFKLEYEQAAQRYENVYRAIWQIFQYMAVLSAGIITFASKSKISDSNESSNFPIQVIVFISLTPLVFWFFATYIPMDEYGKNALEHLKKIETKFNEKFQELDVWEISHYKNFRRYSKPPWRVRNIIIVFGVTISVSWIVSMILTLKNSFIDNQILILLIDLVIFAVTIVLAIDNLVSKSKTNHHDQQPNNQTPDK